MSLFSHGQNSTAGNPSAAAASSRLRKSFSLRHHISTLTANFVFFVRPGFSEVAAEPAGVSTPAAMADAARKERRSRVMRQLYP